MFASKDALIWSRKRNSFQPPKIRRLEGCERRYGYESTPPSPQKTTTNALTRQNDHIANFFPKRKVDSGRRFVVSITGSPSFWKQGTTQSNLR